MALVEQDLDVGNLACTDYRPLNAKKLRKQADSYIDELARENTQVLLKEIFSLPTERADIGRVAHLPECTTPLPREKPVPKRREPTKWEAFAALKGIQKKKRSRKEWDDDAQEYKRRYGYGRGHDGANGDWVVEAKGGAQTGEDDPWTSREKEKRENAAKNKKKQLRNEAKAAPSIQGGIAERLPGTMDLSSLASVQRKQKKAKGAREPKHHVDAALKLAQRSTASMGRFDKLNKSEPKIKLVDKRKQPKKNAEFQQDRKLEKSSSLKILDKIIRRTETSFDEDRAVNAMQQDREKKNRRKKRRKADRE